MDGTNCICQGGGYREQVDKAFFGPPMDTLRKALSQTILNDDSTGAIEGEEEVRELLPASLVEWSYLEYVPGGSYIRHVDTTVANGVNSLTNDDSNGGRRRRLGRRPHHRRAVSVILFLGDPRMTSATTTTTTTISSENSSWLPERDGGCLRIFVNDDDDDDDFVDVPPTPGTLVVFDSAHVAHQVLETYRPRACVVGWFHRVD